MSERRFDFNGRLVFGLILITLGALFTLDNLNVLESDYIIRWWPSVILAIGIAKLFGLGTMRNLVWGGVFTLFGAVWLGDSLDVIDFDLWDLWPVFLIAIGGSMLMRHLRPAVPAGARAANAEATVHSFALWSGVTRRFGSQAFAGGDVSAMMGGVELDLRGAKFEGGRAVIDVFAMWGGIDIYVSDDCRVVNEGAAIMGAIEDSTKPADNASQTLVIKGFVLMGGVEIKNK
jgi:predicted membrane protein